jgi:hypothetical protein
MDAIQIVRPNRSRHPRYSVGEWRSSGAGDNIRNRHGDDNIQTIDRPTEKDNNQSVGIVIIGHSNRSMEPTIAPDSDRAGGEGLT